MLFFGQNPYFKLINFRLNITAETVSSIRLRDQGRKKSKTHHCRHLGRLQELIENLVCGGQVLHEILLHAEGHLTDVALVGLPGRVHGALVLVHGVGVGELAVAV